MARLREGLAAGDPYEAQQSVKTAYYRLKARRQTQDGYELLQQAAAAQFGAGQFTCGLELAKLLLEVGQLDVSDNDLIIGCMKMMTSQSLQCVSTNGMPAAPDVLREASRPRF